MKCPSCGEEFKATPVDGRVTCPGCGKTLKVKVKAKTEEKATPVEKKEVATQKPKKAEPKPVEPKDDEFDNDEWGEEWGDEAPAKKSAKEPAKVPAKAPKKKPVAEDTYDEDEDDDFDSEDDDFDPAPKKKAATKKKEAFDYDDEDEDEDEDFDPAPRSKAKPRREVGMDNELMGTDLLTFKDALIGMLIGVIPCVGIILLLLSVFGVIFKNKPSIRNMHKAILVIAVALSVFAFLVSALTGSLVVSLLK